MYKAKILSNEHHLFILGIVVSLLGASGIYLLTHHGKKQMQNLCHDISDKTTCLKKNIAHGYQELSKESHQAGVVSLIAGGLTGALLGASLVFLYEKNHEDHSLLNSYIKKPTHILADEVKPKLSSWINKAKSIMDSLSEVLNEDKEEVEISSQQSGSNKLDQMIDLATVGYKVFQHLKKGR